MLFVPVLFFIVINTFHSYQVQSKILFENVTISSDYIQNLFIDEIKSMSNVSKIGLQDVKSDVKCLLQLKELSKLSEKSIQFWDAWGKIPAGILAGHLTDFGNYDECVETSAVLVSSHGMTNGKYCLATFPNLLQPQIPSEAEGRDLNPVLNLELEDMFGRALTVSRNVKLGICIPEVCRPELVANFIEKAMANAFSGRFSGSSISKCSVAKKPDFRTGDIIAIVFFSFIGVLMLLSSCYDLWTSHLQRKPLPLLLAFSVITNGRKLFAINNDKSPNAITCLTGIRVLSIFWVLHCHNYLYYSYQNILNMIYVSKWLESFASMGILMGTVSVDSFFFLSGLLVAWLGLKELDKTKGKLNIALMYLHRYIRLTPALAAVILFSATINRYVGSGPMRQPSDGCETSWWLTLLYVQNYVVSSTSCILQAWYLACDTQLYVLSPLLLIPLWKWGKKVIPGIVILVLLSMGCIIATYFVEGYTNVAGFGNGLLSLPRTYMKTHTRYSPWLVGIIVGYLMHINKNRTVRLPLIAKIAGWVISFGIMLYIILGLHYVSEFPFNSTVGAAAANESLKRVCWALALAWIVFACHFGFGGLVNSILSHPYWQPLGRLNYCMYLLHMLVQEINYGTVKTDVYFSNYTMVLEFLKTLGITFLASIALSLSFEAPILGIEKVIFGGKRKEKSVSCDDLVATNRSPGKEV